MDPVTRGYGSHIPLEICARLRISRVHFRRPKVAGSASLAVPELTRSTDIQVNEGV